MSFVFGNSELRTFQFQLRKGSDRIYLCGMQESVEPKAPAVRVVDLIKEYPAGQQTVRVVDGISFTIPRRQFTAIVGRSGSGKSTLLNLMAGLDVPSSGEIWVAGEEIGRLSDDRLTRLRRDQIGIVYQFFNLLPTLSVRENVALPALLAGAREAPSLSRADQLLEEVGLSQRRNARPHTLSGGEMQRVALARALVHQPALVLADEPTGNLDSRAAEQVMEMLLRLASAHEATIVLVTHNAEMAASADRIIELRDGRVLRDDVRTSKTQDGAAGIESPSLQDGEREIRAEALPPG